jgi:DMSO/TMAO reductase YedYZ molybdopterin-dependent catalytic subunit
MPFPWANTVLLTFIIAQLVSGFFGLTNGVVERAWILWIHGIGAYALLLVLFWKAAVVLRSLAHRRNPAERLLFLATAAVLVATLASGVLWTFGGQRQVLVFSLITFHVILALSILLPLAWHVVRMRFVFRIPSADDRRAMLRAGALAIAGAALWRFGGWARERLDLPGAARRFTGSYETGSFTGDFPFVVWLLDFHPPIDAPAWRLSVGGEVERPFSLGYEEVLALAGDRVEGLIDCTGGWYSTQSWEGVAVAKLLERAGVKPSALSVSFETDSGYARRFDLEKARRYLLAVKGGGEVLDHGHGFPLRLVAPDYRGFNWVKWITRVQVHATPKWLQTPVPLR